MKFIVAIIRPESLDQVIKALKTVDVYRLTVSDCRGVGGLEKTAEVYRGSEYTVNYRHKTKLEIAVNEEFLQPTLDTIRDVCHTGDPTDGVIFVTDLLDCVNIGSGKTGPEGI